MSIPPGVDSSYFFAIFLSKVGKKPKMSKTAQEKMYNLVLRLYCLTSWNLECIMKLDRDCGPTVGPGNMIGVPREPAWLEEEGDATKNPDFKTQLS